MGATLSQLIPIQELTPGQIGAIRNGAINYVVALAARELAMSEDKLVVRDIRPKDDLALYGASGTDAAAAFNSWYFDCSAETVGSYKALGSATGTMGDQRYVAIFGVRDQRLNSCENSAGADVSASIAGLPPADAARVSLIRLTVGGAYKVIWDTRCMQAYTDALVAFSPSPVIIPQNSSFLIEYQFDISKESTVRLQLIGVVVEPRGKVISP